MKIKLLLLVFISIIISFSCAKKNDVAGSETWNRIVKKGILNIGTDISGTPFAYLENGKYIGFEIDIIKAIAKELGLTANVIKVPFGLDNFDKALNSHEVDVIVESITKTKERLDRFSFSSQYFTSGQAIILAKNEEVPDKFELSMLNDKKVGVEKGTTGAYFADNYLKSNIVVYETSQDALNALIAGDVYAIVNDVLSSKTSKWEMWDKIKVVKKNLTQEEYGIIVKKGEDLLIQKLNYALAKLKEDPVDSTYAKLYRKWFY